KKLSHGLGFSWSLSINAPRRWRGNRNPSRRGLAPNYQNERCDIMTTKLPLPEPTTALAYFRDKITFTTGPAALEPWITSHASVKQSDLSPHVPHPPSQPRL